MGSGKTTWVIDEVLNRHFEKNILYITPYLDEIDRIRQKTKREIYDPKYTDNSKLENIRELLSYQVDIASTHALFMRFDEDCKQVLQQGKYTLILDETLTAVMPYKFQNSEDFDYLIANGDIRVKDNGMIEWIGTDLDTRFNDVRTLSKNQCLFRVDDKFYLWLFPPDIFGLFENVYIMTYMFDGSIMKYYFDLYNIQYELKSIAMVDGKRCLTEYYQPDKQCIRERIKVHNGRLNNIAVYCKDTALSSSWCGRSQNRQKMEQLQKNMVNFVINMVKVKSSETMWTTYKKCKSLLSYKGYAKGFIACNSRATNEYADRTCLMYCCNWYENPEIVKFFSRYGVMVQQDKIALSNLLQWVWRSNIRVPDSDKIINIYIPSRRMRELFLEWLKE